MHRGCPTFPHNGQLIDEAQFGSHAPPYPLASPTHEEFRIKEAVSCPPYSENDESSESVTSLAAMAVDAQPFSPDHFDECKMEVAATKDHGLLGFGDSDDDACYGHTSKPPGQHVGLSGSPASSDVLEPCLENRLLLDGLPNEVVLHVLGFLDMSDLVAMSRTNRALRQLSLCPILHRYRLQRTREVLPPLLWSAARPTIADLKARRIILTHTSFVSRRLARALVSIRLSRRLASRPPVEDLVTRCVLPKECVPGMCSIHVSPGLVAKRKAIERENVKDRLRRWIGGKWKGEVQEREQELRRWHESRGIGRVWKLTKFWEQIGRGQTTRCLSG
ncbi:hypothetical protein E4U57_001516 [Claviceps arundinis]|uniref:F-box domain-containing protein n=1 Tax=Claviceps arundinis TaxID=1623583 RepID=A0ABQ7PEB4_9HYPO|nr:hypothetical protein E4U57_001516 [Claviceps arundinis]